jgi:hypothetical protein
VVLIIYQFRARRPLLTIRTMLTVVPLKAAIYEQRKTDALRAGPPELLMGVLHDVACASMGLGAGGEIRQSIETPVESPENWELQTNASAWVHIANSRAWQRITGERPPILAPSTADYSAPGLPWFDWYDDTFARSGSDILARAKSVHTLGGERKESPVPENESFDPPEPIRLGHPRKEVPGPTPS